MTVQGIRAGLVVASVGVLSVLVRGSVQMPAPAASPTPPTISGYWELSYDSRKVPKAKLLPTVTAAKLQRHAILDAHAIRWCNLMGLPFAMDPGRPIDIREGPTVVIIAPENVPNPRYLYKRTAHISSDIYDPSTLGDSIAHWEGDTLVADTIGFHATRGVTTLPGGGYRTDKSHLVERYRLIENGNILSVTFTWTDPTVFAAPHTYEFRYYRLPAGYEARAALPCDPYDDVRSEFLGDPLQPKGPAKAPVKSGQ
jgi:hypothetical protein